MAYAALGLIASLSVHLMSFAGMTVGNAVFMGLHAGIFPLWIVVMPLVWRRQGGWSFQRRQSWKAMLAGCPPWMKFMTYGFFAYAIVNFAIFFITMSKTGPIHTQGTLPAFTLRGFSGHWMAFYSAGLAAATSLYKTGSAAPRCPNGHVVGIDDRFCPTCGVALTPSSNPTA